MVHHDTLLIFHLSHLVGDLLNDLDCSLDDDVKGIALRFLQEHSIALRHHDQTSMIAHVFKHILVMCIELFTKELDVPEAVLEDLSLVIGSHELGFTRDTDDLLCTLLRVIVNHLLNIR